jgi:hypothetical protein
MRTILISVAILRMCGPMLAQQRNSLQPSRRRYVLTSSEEEGSACSQTSIVHHW